MKQSPNLHHVEKVTLYDDGDSIALIRLSDGTSQSPTWSSLLKHLDLAIEPDSFESLSAWWCRDRILFCFTWAHDQGGAIACWNWSVQEWEQVVEAAFVLTAWIDWSTETILSVHCLHDYMTPSTLCVFVTPLCKGITYSDDMSALVRKQKIVTPSRSYESPEIEQDEGKEIIRITYQHTTVSISRDEIAKARLSKLPNKNIPPKPYNNHD